MNQFVEGEQQRRGVGAAGDSDNYRGVCGRKSCLLPGREQASRKAAEFWKYGGFSDFASVCFQAG